MGEYTIKISTYSIPPLLFLITGFSLAIISIVKGRRNYENIIFALLCIWFSLLSLAFISHFIFWGDITLILKIERGIHFVYVYLPAIAILFFYHIVQYKNRIVIIVSFLISFALSLSTFTDYYFSGLYEFSWGYIAKGGPAFQVMGVYSLTVVTYSAILAFRKLRITTDPTYRLRLKYLFFSMCAIGVLSLGNIPAINGINLYPIGNFSFIPILVMAWGIYRHDIIKINQYTKRRIFGTITRVAVVTGLAAVTGVGLWAFRDYSLSYLVERTVPYGIPPLLSFIVCVYLSIIGLQVGENRRESFVFSLAILVYAFLGFDIYFNCVVADRDLCLIVSRINHAFLVFLPSLILHLFILVTGRTRSRRIAAIAYGLSALFALFTHSDLYLTGSRRYYWGYFAQGGILFDTMGLLGTICLIYCLVLMLKSFRETANRNTRRRYLFLLIGASTTGLLTLGNIPAMHGLEIYPAGNFIFISVILFTMGIFKYNIAEFARLTGRIFYYGALVAGVIIAAVYLPGITDLLPQPLGHALAFGAVLAFGFGLRAVLRRLLSSRRTRLARAYEELNDGLSKCRSVQEISDILSASLFRSIMPEYCTFLHLDADNDLYVAQRKSPGYPGAPACGDDGGDPPPVKRDHSLLDLFFLGRRPLRQEEIEEWLLYNDRNVPMDDMIRSAELSVPFFFEDRLMGLLLLGPKRDGSVYSKDEVDFLSRLGLGVAPYLKNANLLQNLENLVNERTGELQNSEQKYRHLIENATDGIFRNDIRGNFIFVNPSGLKLLGYSLDELTSMNYRDLVPAGYREAVMQHYSDQLKNTIPETYLEFPVVQKGGAEIWLGQNVRLEKNSEGRYEFYGISRDVTERKKAELALKTSEKKYRTILRSINEAYYEVDLKGTTTFVNNSFCSLIGYGMNECLGKNYSELLNARDADEIYRIFNRIYATGAPSDIFDLRFMSRDGRERTAQGTASLIIDAGGNKIGFRGLLRDVTELKSAEEALRKSEERYRDFIEKLPVIVFEVDAAGILTYVNSAGLRLLGYAIDEVMHRPAAQFIQAEEHQAVHHGMERIINEGKTYQNVRYHALRNDGTLMPVHLSTSRLLDRTQGGGFQGILVDLTEIEQAQKALRESEEKYRLLIENAGDIISIIDSDAIFKYVSPSAEKILGYGQEIIGKNYLREMVPKEYRKEISQFYLRQIAENIPETNTHFPIINKSGQVVWLEMNSRLVKDEHGHISLYGISRDITGKKMAEEALRESEEKYRTILETMEEPYFEVNLKGDMVFCNDATLRTLGYSREELLSMNFRDYHDEETVQNLIQGYNAVYRGETPKGFIEYDIIKKDGSICRAELSINLIRDRAGNPVGFRGIARDITARKKAEKDLRASEERYRIIVESARDAIYRLDAGGRFTFCNLSGLEMTGYSMDEVMSMHFWDMVHPDHRKGVIKTALAQLSENIEKQYFEFPVVRKNGSMFWVGQISMQVRDNSGNPEFHVIARDITERIKAEEALRESEERYRSIIENMNDGYYELDLKGNLIFANDAMCEITGYTRDEDTGINFRSYLSEETRRLAQETFGRIYAQRLEGEVFEYELVRKDGTRVWLSSSISIITDNSGNATGFRGLARDITKKIEAEHARRELEEQKSRFFANVSHEIRTPLTLMLSPIESYLQGDYRKEIGREFFENLYRNGLRLLKLINNLLDFSKLEAGRMSMRVAEIDIARFLRNYIASLQSACDSRGITLNFAPCVGTEKIHADPEKLDRVFMNLFSNALKFTDRGGTITVALREDEVFCYIDFEDTGQGIPKGSIDRIFERFGQAETSAARRLIGTGIGLALAKELVAMHGGTITVRSRFIEDHPDDHGSVFTVTLLKGKEHFGQLPDVTFGEPSEIDQSVSDHRFAGMREMDDLKTGPAPAAAQEYAGHPGNAPSVLIVDDNPDMREFLTALLKAEYAVITAANGREGLEAIKLNAPDLVITDVMMPEMDGYEMTRRIKADPGMKHTPVVMLTAKAEISHKIEGLEFGADDYLTKPFNSKELLTRVKTLLKTREYERVIARRNREIEEELEVARQLQQRLLPEQIRDIPGYDYHAIYIPMDKVGGDFYDLARRDHYLDLFIADVSGHGLPGAFLAMMTKMALGSIVMRTSTNGVLALLNDVIHRATVNSNYVSAFLCTIDTRSNTMRYSNAGHFPPLLFRRKTGKFIELRANGRPLGWFTDITLEEKETTLRSGDRLILYTDGITECANMEGELFGDDRLRQFIRDNRDLQPQEFSSALVARLKDFSGSDSFEDDLTMVVFDVE